MMFSLVVAIELLAEGLVYNIVREGDYTTTCGGVKAFYLGELVDGETDGVNWLERGRNGTTERAAAYSAKGAGQGRDGREDRRRREK
jgi:hypothetical protein